MTYEEKLALTVRMLKHSYPEGEPVVLVPIDENGKECGPPEVHYAPPTGPSLN